MGDTELLRRVEALVSPYGLVSRVSPRRPARGLDWVDVWVASAGSLRAQTGEPGRSERPGRPGRPGRSGRSARTAVGAGLSVRDGGRSRLVAVAEAAERYAGSDFGEPARWARAVDLDGPAVGPDTIARCSDAELATDGCPLTVLDAGMRIRWVRGTDLCTGGPVWLPAVMACYGLRPACPQERFWYQISTGYAVHTDPVEALLNAVLEVAERDAIALTWVQRLPLALIGDADLSEPLAGLIDWSRRHFIDTYLFDATTDIGIPTVYCLQIAPHDSDMRQAVGCASARTMAAAARKALLEVLRYRMPGAVRPEVPDDFRDFSAIAHGATYMGRPERAAAFGFLTDGARDRIGHGRPALPEDPLAALAEVTATLRAKGMHAVAVDRTTRELADVGLAAVCVVIPELQPMSLLPLAKYLAHPRLYQAPPVMGHRSLAEEELNPWPQPFA